MWNDSLFEKRNARGLSNQHQESKSVVIYITPRYKMTGVTADEGLTLFTFYIWQWGVFQAFVIMSTSSSLFRITLFYYYHFF